MANFVYRHKTPLLLSLLLLLVYFPIFLHLDYMTFRLWDESMTGINVIEMMDNHNYIVTHFYGAPDMWVTKPPLLVWCIVLFSKILGFNELSLRLPSALAALALCLYLFFAIRKYSASAAFGFIVVIVLITCKGYIRTHVTRTGEYDSLLILFSTISSLELFFAVEADDKREQSKHLLCFFIFLTLAVLSKGVTCLIFSPGLFVYTLLRKKVIPFLQNRNTYVGISIFLTFGIGYYLLREAINHGYLKAVWENELGGRFADSLEGHVGPWTYYLTEIANWQFVEYLFWLPLAFVAGLFSPNSKIQRVVCFCCCVGGVFLLIISTAKTKMTHYDAPLFPFLAVIIGSLFFTFYKTIKEYFSTDKKTIAGLIVSSLVIVSLFSSPYNRMISSVYFPKGEWWDEPFYNSCKFFQQVVRNNFPINNYKLVFDDKGPIPEGAILKCYLRVLNEGGSNPKLIRSNEVYANDSVVVFNNETKQQLAQKFDLIVLSMEKQSKAEFIFVKNKERKL